MNDLSLIPFHLFVEENKCFSWKHRHKDNCGTNSASDDQIGSMVMLCIPKYICASIRNGNFIYYVPAIMLDFFISFASHHEQHQTNCLHMMYTNWMLLLSSDISRRKATFTRNFICKAWDHKAEQGTCLVLAKHNLTIEN